ncbi:MAG: hypothetical protein KatS3mg093_290 [Candidatus Parcubacteria bacterium]|nr:MAG: hypothetical protein KatS3mg093_290 [Candidatus Parcubacteria bacterium]
MVGHGEFLCLVFFVLITVLAFYFGLNFGFKNYLNSQINKFDVESKKIAQSISEGDQNKLMLFYSQATNISKLLKNRKTISQVFSWLEKNTISDVSFNKFNLNKIGNQINLGGIAKSKESALNQILVFQSSPDIKTVVLNNLSSLDQNNWQFDLTILFKESFFISNNNNN